MKVGVIGSGGREHAICVSLKESSKVEKIYCFPGNAGTSEIAKNVALNLDNFEDIKKLDDHIVESMIKRFIENA